MNDTITIVFGLRTLTAPINGRTLGAILREEGSSLRIGENVRYYVNGEAVGTTVVPRGGMTIEVRTGAHEKAV